MFKALQIPDEYEALPVLSWDQLPQNEMLVYGFHGVSFISKLIKWRTWHWCSHIAIGLRDGSVAESWIKGGVSIGAFGRNHTTGTKALVYRFREGVPSPKIMEGFLRGHVGDGYALGNILAFVIRTEPHEDDKWICSEYGAEASKQGGRQILQLPSSKISPRDHVVTPILEPIGWRIV